HADVLACRLRLRRRGCVRGVLPRLPRRPAARPDAGCVRRLPDGRGGLGDDLPYCPPAKERVVTGVLWACFALSGVASLALEMLWMRSAALVFGGTAATSASVLSCYFAGLAVGALIASRGSTRPVRRYGALELGAAAGAAWSVVAFTLLASEDGHAWLAHVGPVAQLATVACAILPATTCLGATLPTLGQALARDAVGRRGGVLYSLNTLGAAAGAAAAGFGLPALVGVRASYALTIVASGCAGIVAL